MEKSPVVACVSQNGQAAAKLTWNIDSGMLNTGWVGIDVSGHKLQNRFFWFIIFPVQH